MSRVHERYRRAKTTDNDGFHLPRSIKFRDMNGFPKLGARTLIRDHPTEPSGTSLIRKKSQTCIYEPPTGIRGKISALSESLNPFTNFKQIK